MSDNDKKDDQKINTDDIDLTFDDDFEAEVEDVLSEKTAVVDVDDPAEAPTHKKIEEKKLEVDDQAETKTDIAASDLELDPEPDDLGPSEGKTEVIESDFDEGALDFSDSDLAGESEEIELADLPESIEGSSESTELHDADELINKDEKLKSLFDNMSKDLSSGKKKEFVSDEIGANTEIIDSEDYSGDQSPKEQEEPTKSSPSGLEVQEPSQSQSITKDQPHEPSKSVQSKKSSSRKPKVSLGLIFVAIGCVLILFVAYAVFFTPAGLFGFSMQTFNLAAETETKQEIKLTPELLQNLEQKYDQGTSLMQVDQYRSYQNAAKIFTDILETYPNHPKASSALSLSLLLGARGYLDENTVSRIDKSITHAEKISPNTKETLRAKIHFFIYQNKLEDAQVRINQLEKIEDQKEIIHLLKAELAVANQNWSEAESSIHSALEIDPNIIRARYVEGIILKAQQKYTQAKAVFRSLIDNNQHLASLIAYYDILNLEKNKTLIEDLETAFADQGKNMSASMFAKGKKILSEAYLRKNDVDQGIKALEEAVSRMPRNDAYSFELASLYEGKRNYRKSLEYYKQSSQTKPENPQYKIAYAKSLRMLNEFKAAEDVLEPITQNHPELEEGFVEYARSRIAQGFHQEVQSYLIEVIAKHPSYARCKIVLGDIYFRNHEMEDAKKIYLDALKVAKSNTDKAHANRLLGEIAIAQESWTQAMDYLLKADRLVKRDSQTLYAIAKVHFERKRYPQAESFVIESLKEDSSNLLAKGILAQVHYQKGEVEEAKRILREVLYHNPKNVPIRVTLSKILIAEKDYKDAIKHLEEVYLYDATHYETHFNLGIAQRETGRIDVAIRSFSRAIELWPQSYHAYYQRGITYTYKGDLVNASKDMDKAIELRPGWQDPIRALAQHYFNVGMYEKSIEYYKKIIEINSKDQEALYYLGRASFQNRFPQEALSYYTKLIQVNPRHAKALFEIGVVLEDNEDFEQALRYYLRSRNIDQKSADTYHRLGFVYKNLGMRKQAIQSFQVYLKLRPEALDKVDIEDEIFRLQRDM